MANHIHGVHAVYEALTAQQPIERIHIAREVNAPRLREILDLARKRDIPVRKEDRAVIDRMAQGEVHQGIIAVVGDFTYSPIEKIFEGKQPCAVILDGVEDPHNFGAVIRTAEACNVSGVIVPERHSAPLTATVAKSSAGALAHVPVVRVKNLVSTIDELKKRSFWVVGVDAAGEKPWTGFDYTGPIALVFGGEHRGLRRLVREHCDVVVHLPMLGKISSLNISVAAGVVLYEVVRQRASK